MNSIVCIGFCFAVLTLLTGSALGTLMPFELEWDEWGACSRSCGGGTQARRRICDADIDHDTCLHLKSIYSRRDLKETRPCNTHHCEVTGIWSTWGDWQACSASCGVNGFQVRRRLCNDENNTGSGEPVHCEGASFETRPCDPLPTCPRESKLLESNLQADSFSSLHSVSSGTEQSSMSSDSWEEE